WCRYWLSNEVTTTRRRGGNRPSASIHCRVATTGASFDCERSSQAVESVLNFFARNRSIRAFLRTCAASSTMSLETLASRRVTWNSAYRESHWTGTYPNSDLTSSRHSLSCAIRWLVLLASACTVAWDRILSSRMNRNPAFAILIQYS